MKRALVVLIALAACDARDRPATGNGVVQQSTQADLPARFGGIGRAATPAEVRALDIDVNSAGVGLPPGRGTYARGAEVFATQCASCHGARGEGIAPYPALIGNEPADFSFANDPKLRKTVGNYWPHATTLFDYINRAMPFAAPGTLSAEDVYSVVAFLLAENGVIEKTTVMDRRTLPAVRMPARDRFVPDNRRGGAEFR